MTIRHRLQLHVFIFAILAILAAQAFGQQSMDVQVDGHIRLAASGDAVADIVLDVNEVQYNDLRTAMPDARIMLREFASNESDDVYTDDSTCMYDDAATAVRLTIHQIAAASYTGDGRWMYVVDDADEFINLGPDADGNPSVFLRVDHVTADGVRMHGFALVSLPIDARDVRWDDAAGAVCYTLPLSTDDGDPVAEVSLDARDQIMSAAYKAYGMGGEFGALWVAKAIVRNAGDGVMHDLRIRYRVEGYSEWSVWQKFDEVVPGQSVVSVYYPVLDRAIAEIQSMTPANVICEWQWRDSEGNVHDDAAGERITILGSRQFAFSDVTAEYSRSETFSWLDDNENAPFIAAWVFEDDPVVTQFAALANRMAGGEGAIYSDDAAKKVLRACYDIMVVNDFTYQGPVALDSGDTTLKNSLIQRIRFPRDVIKDRAGTCIELSVLYASMAHAVGLRPYVVIVPGHAFVVIELPSGEILPVETTGIRGGLQPTALTFEQATAFATDVLDDSKRNETLIVVDVHELWTQGIVSPELPALPADILQMWGIRGDAPTAALISGQFAASGDAMPDRSRVMRGVR